LPVTALETDAETAVSLVRAGLRTIGDLVDRPQRILAARFGEALTAKLQRILGREDIRITPERPLPDCMAERHFPEPLTELMGLQAVFLALARDVCDVLEQRGSGGRRFEASLFRCDGVVQRLAIETGAPCRDEAAILRLLNLRMETLADPLNPGFGFDAVRFAVSLVDPIAERQSSLDGRAVENTALSDLVDRLVIRFGRDRVLQFVACDTHDPVHAGALIPATETVRSAISPRPEPGEPPLRPIQMFQRPQPIEVLAEVPDAPPLRFRWRRVLHEIARAEGPERIAPDWWLEGNNAPATRDYYRIEDVQGRRFWVFREGLYGEDARPHWFMHGLVA
jgi:protein ImuB